MKFLALLLVFVSLSAWSEIEAEWIRSPAISPDGKTIVFTYKGDLYRVASAGGDALRLTFHPAHDSFAVWHPQGDKIAFASDRNGNFDIYVMDAKGGEAQRLTYHSSDETPYSFTHDGQDILFSAARMDSAQHRQYPDTTFPELYRVASEGSRVEQVLTTPAVNVDISADGQRMLYQDIKGGENYWRKHHQSAVTRDIWLYDVKSSSHKQLTTFAGEDRDPVFAQDGKSFYFLSEREGTFNVFQADIETPDQVRALSQFELHPVRFLSEGNGMLAFTHHGQLYTMKAGEQAQAVKISIRTQDASDALSMESISGEITEMEVSPEGDEIAFVARGDVFVASTDGKFVKQITKSPYREAFISFSADGESLYYSAERNTQWGIYKAEKERKAEPFFYAASLIKQSEVRVNENDNYQPKISPDGKKIAFIENRRTLRVMDIDGSDAKTLVERKEMIHFRDGDQSFSWSPDSQWLVFTHDKLLNNSNIAVVKADGSETFKTLSTSAYYERNGKWLSNGKQILWLSNREGLRSYATSGSSELDVYSLFLTQEAWDEFRLSEDDFELQQAIDKANAPESDDDKDDDDSDANEKASEPINIEWKGLEDRIARLTIHSSMISDAVLSKDGETLYYLTRFEDSSDLWSTKIRTKETQKLISLGVRGGSLQWDAKYENLYLLSAGNISKLDVDKNKNETLRISHQVEIDHAALRQSVFEHVWLRTQKAFYEPNYHGINWKLMYQEYKPKVAHLGNGYEMAELLSEMIGELNVSHAGARYRSMADNRDSTAYLGVFHDPKHRGNGLKVVEVLNGGPLDKASFDVSQGMLIDKIDGVQITPDFDWAKLLNNKAGSFVLLDLVSPKGEQKQLTIKPINAWEHSRLLYQRFVDINEQEVLRRSNNQLGYVHIPSMSDGPYRNVYDIMLGKHYDKKAMVVDARFNGGGDLVADLAMFFTGESFLTYATADKVVGGEPTSRYTKPVITLFNEDMYSDGHCYASGYTDLKIGKSVGMPVPGTCSFAGWEGLATGGSWGMVPVSAKNKAGEWLENNQTAPDVIIRNDAEHISKGRDQQLEKAIELMLQDLKD